MRFFALILIFLPLVINAFSQEVEENRQFYEVKKGDTLGEILLRFDISPLWGPEGSIKKTIKLNPDAIEENGDLLYPNTLIKLPGDTQRNIATQKPHETDKEKESEKESVDSLTESLLSDFDLMMGINYWQLKSEEKDDGSKARLESKMNPSISLSWNVEWSSFTQTFINVGLSKINFKDVVEKEIEGLGENYGQFSIGQRFKFSHGWEVTGVFEYKQTPYLRSLTIERLKIESPWVKSFKLSVQKTFFERSNGEMSIGVTPYYSQGKKMQDFTINEGHGAQLYLGLKQNFENFGFQASIFSEYGKQDSSITRQTWQSNGVYFGFIIPIGERP